MALRIESSPVQSLSAGFELSGNAQTGELVLFTPLGSTYASLSWRPASAQLRVNGDVRAFNSLDELVLAATGADLPIASLFLWLSGENMVMPGWQVDLGDLPKGKLQAFRTEPTPRIELRIALDK